MRIPSLALALFLTGTLGASAAEIDTEASIFAIVTHKAGFAAAKAHNHLIAAAGYVAELEYDADEFVATRFDFSTKTQELLVDPAGLKKDWSARIVELGILDAPFSEDLSDKDRGKIRKAMLEDDQLAAAEHSEITAEIRSIARESQTVAAAEFPYTLALALTVRGETVEKPVAARVGENGEIEAVGAFAFTDFGIEPYSAFLGAVRNEDTFHVYVNVRLVD